MNGQQNPQTTRSKQIVSAKEGLELALSNFNQELTELEAFLWNALAVELTPVLRPQESEAKSAGAATPDGAGQPTHDPEYNVPVAAAFQMHAEQVRALSRRVSDLHKFARALSDRLEV